MNLNLEIEIAIRAAFEAGVEILNVYDTDFEVLHKSDHSPLTEADQKAHRLISTRLKPTAIPVLSEEGRTIPYEQRKDWNRFWMVDPLDGTKEFVKRNGEFTVNIALIENNRAVAGVIYVPVSRTMYFGIVGRGAYKIQSFSDKQLTYTLSELMDSSLCLPAKRKKQSYTVVGSRSHKSPETTQFMKELEKEHGSFETISMGSSLKICLVAEGAADIYPRFAPTMEWDTAAGHGIIRAVGKDIIDQSTGESMLYNKENLLNNSFIVK